MDNTASTSQNTNAPPDVPKSKRMSKKSIVVARKKAKQQQEADMTGIGSQFWPADEAAQSSDPRDYPHDLTVEE
ncbi:hypothetical protein SAMD00023353_9700100 [Rosellinia necatrix]|uniref:Uncharacterized protein n=1 Tax=Rosellinia necatrix TaxID=77044 RepID=A0A1W2TW45_ROSNE|nr:hypothetical protein SAMD00023353_9700100 [Rosellinia necatrix]